MWHTWERKYCMTHMVEERMPDIDEEGRLCDMGEERLCDIHGGGKIV